MYECSTLLPFCLFIRHPLSKFTLQPCDKRYSYDVKKCLKYKQMPLSE